MTPQQMFMADPTLTPAEKLEDLRWRRTASPEQIARADALTAYWYEQKAEAQAFRERIAALVERKYDA